MTPPGNKETDEHPDPYSDGDGLAGMLMHGFVDRLGPFVFLHANAIIDLLNPFKPDGEALAGLPCLLPCYIGSGRHQCACIFGQSVNVLADSLCLFFHILYIWLFQAFTREAW